MLVNMSGGKVEEITKAVDPVLLWTNPDSTTSFGAQTITLPTGYDGYLVEAVNTTSRQNNPIITYIPFFDGNNQENAQSVGTYAYSGNRRYSQFRVVTSAGDGFITFGAAYEGAGATGTMSDSNAIPTRIWGVKFTL